MKQNLNPAQKNKLSLAMIVKDETTELDSCLASIADFVDEIVVAWNGTNEETKQILERYSAKIVKYQWNDDFAEARNASFQATTNPFVLWLDSDDTVEGAKNIPTLMQQFDDPHLGALWAYYDYDQDEYGNTTMVVWRERIVRKDWFSWSGKLHEECLKTKDCIQSKIPKEQMFIKHHPQKDRINRSGERNLRISEKVYNEEHNSGDVDAFNVWNYARSLNAMGKFQESAGIFEEFIAITSSDEHRYQACSILSEIYRKMHQYDRALDTDLRAIKIKPKWPDAYFNMARNYFLTEDWDNVIFYTDLGYKMEHPKEKLPVPYDPLSFTVKPLEPLTYALVQQGKFNEALVASQKALKFLPDNKYFKNWIKILTKAIERESVEKACLTVYEYLQKNEGDKIEHFVNALPKIAQDHPLFVWLQNKHKDCGDGSNRIIIYCGTGIMLWDAKSAEEGIGGSEEAVINISRELAKQGWEVEVYNNCLDEGIYDGVLWQGVWRYDQNRPCHTFIGWRDTRSIMYAPKESYKVLWLHDVTKYEYFTDAQLAAIDKIFVLSKYHRENLPEIPDDKFWITSNGIIPSHFDEKVTRNPKACIYASSPDRGLERVLENWKDIKKEVPDAELHIFYGFTKNYDVLHRYNQNMKDFKQYILELLDQDGVTYHGMVNHKELAKWFLYCGLWLYPTSFTEISCITGMKTQAAGTVPIISNVAALDETVKFGVKVNDPKDEAELKRWKEQTIYYLKNPDNQDDIRKDMMEWARYTYDWKRVAKNWSDFFKDASKSETRLQRSDAQKEQV